MIIKNWMRKNQISIPSNMVANEAMKIFNGHNERYILVVDEGKLRGILDRRDLIEALSYATASQSIHEVNFFNTKLKVKDLMIRKPITLSTTDTIEKALIEGVSFGIGYFPVLEDKRVVGMVSRRDTFRFLLQILGVNEKFCGMTVKSDHPEGRVVTDIIQGINLAGGVLHSLFTLKNPETGNKRFVVRFEANDMVSILVALKEKGYEILEIREA